MMRAVLPVLTGLALLACEPQGSSTKPGADAAAVACTAPRPQACTREYLPVCGERRDGSRRTYGNACDACADPGVERHRVGPCN